MSNRSGAFAGIALSQQSGDNEPGLDQKLFSQRPAYDGQPQTHEVRKEGSREVGKEGSQDIDTRALEGGNERPSRKDSFLFTNEEFEALEDLKLDLRRRFAIRATKNDIVRCALQHLIEDCRSNGELSIAVRRFRTRGRI